MPTRGSPPRRSRAIPITPQSVGPLLDGLAADGLVVRRRDAGPRRAVHTEVTEQGRRRPAEAVQAVAASDAELTADLSEDDARRLAALVHGLADRDRSA